MDLGRVFLQGCQCLGLVSIEFFSEGLESLLDCCLGFLFIAIDTAVNVTDFAVGFWIDGHQSSP